MDGQYQLKEVTPPKGYVITNDTPVTFTVSESGITNTNGTIAGVTYTAASQTAEASFRIPNEPGAALPSAGGPGTNHIYLLGCMLTGLAGTGLVTWRRTRDPA